MKLTILHIFPEILNLYGDSGNIKVLQKRCRLRGIETEIIPLGINDTLNLKNADILYLGSGIQKDQKLVAQALVSQKQELQSYRDDNGVMLAVSTAYPMLGHTFPTSDGMTDGLGLCDITTEESSQKHMGNIAIDTPFGVLVGFENHTTKTKLGDSVSPLGRVLHGYGNNGEDHQEGALYKNIYGTYLQGPLLPSNPELTDLLIAKAIERKYGSFPELALLPNELENLAKGYILNYGNRTQKR